MRPFLDSLNDVLMNPTESAIYALFEVHGFLRFNMLYISPMSLKHFKIKLSQHGLISWRFTESELIFELEDQTVLFRGTLCLTAAEKIFCLEFDFDPIIADDRGIYFLRDVETFLKKCDSCFFMTYFICIDSEILSHPLSQSIEYLMTRK